MLNLSEQKALRRKLNKKLRIYYVSCQIVALIAFVLMFPFLLMTTVIITIELFLAEKRFLSPFFKEIRYTQGRKFELFKFIALKPDGQPLISGDFLKKIYLDELPQLWHIACGDMVFVGPRPNPEEDYNRIKSQGFYAKVLQRAGLTGGVQTAKGSDHHGDLTLDEDYMHFCLNHSILEIIKKDFQVFLQTLRLMKKAEGL